MKQITIITKNQAGIMSEIADALASANVNIETLSAHTVGDTGIAIATVNNYDAALRALAQTPFRAISEDALVVSLEDKPGELARITRRFKKAGINMQSIRIIRRHAGKSIVAISTRRTQEAVELVRDVIIS